MAKRNDWKGIPQKDRAAVRKWLAAFNQCAKPMDAYLSIQVGREREAREQKAREDALAQQRAENAEEHRQWARDDVADQLHNLALLRDTLNSMAKGEQGEGDLPEDRAIYAHALIEKIGRVLEQSLCNLAVIPGKRGKFNDGWFIENLRSQVKE